MGLYISKLMQRAEKKQLQKLKTGNLFTELRFQEYLAFWQMHGKQS